jgi:general secretion pathway protein L
MHRILGIDIAATQLRVVALESGFRGFSVIDARAVPIPDGSGSLGERLKGPLAGIAADGESTVAVAVPASQVASYLFTLPFTDNRRIEQVLPAEVEGAIPFDLSEVVWDHAVLSQSDGKTDVLVAVVRKTALEAHLAALREAGLDPRVMTFAPLALGALAERSLLGGATPGAEAILDAGPDRANLCVLEGGRPTLARALASAGPLAWAAARDHDAALERLVGPLARDLKMSLRARKAGGWARLSLAGELAAIPGVGERLSRDLGIPVAPLALATPLPQQAGEPEHALALGLALRAQHPRGKLDFRKGEFAFVRDLSQARGNIAKLAVAVGILLILAIGLGAARVASLGRQARDYDDALCAATRKIVGTCMTDYRQAIAALSGGRSRTAGIPRVSAADVLAELVAHLPEGAMPTLDDVDLTTTTVRLRGVAESFGKVDELIAALRKDRCFGDIKQPRTEKQRDSSKVNFSLEFAYTCSGEQPGGAG